MITTLIEIDAFPMLRDALGARHSSTTETPDFWDVIVPRADHVTGVVEVLDEHEDLTTAEAFDVVAAMEAKYLGADDSDRVLPAAPDTAPGAANLIEGPGR